MANLTVKQCASRLGVSAGVVYQLAASGRLAHSRFGLGRGTIRVAEEDLQAFEAGCKAAAPPPVRRAPRPPRPQGVYRELFSPTS